MTTNVFIFLGEEGPGPAEQWVAGGRRAALEDAAHQAARLPDLDRLVVATAERDWRACLHGLPLSWEVDPPGETFHFGERLAGLMERYPADVHVYLGAGSVPLLPEATLAEAVQSVRAAPAPSAVTNNLHSSDWIVLNCPAAVHARTGRLARDNALGWVLQHEAGVSVRSLPPGAATRVDIDTPADLLLLSLHPGTGPALSAYLRAAPRSADSWRQAARVLFTPATQAALIGRVPAHAWSHLDAHTQCWVRVFSEERGMAASGRQATGQVRSLVARYLEQVGPAAFFAELQTMAEAVLFDTRVLLAHQHRWPAAADRYASDLGQPDLIQDSSLRALTLAAVNSPMPVVLGGHGVVSGALYALVEIAQAGGLETG